MLRDVDHFVVGVDDYRRRREPLDEPQVQVGQRGAVEVALAGFVQVFAFRQGQAETRLGVDV